MPDYADPRGPVGNQTGGNQQRPSGNQQRNQDPDLIRLPPPEPEESLSLPVAPRLDLRVGPRTSFETDFGPNTSLRHQSANGKQQYSVGTEDGRGYAQAQNERSYVRADNRYIQAESRVGEHTYVSGKYNHREGHIEHARVEHSKDNRSIAAELDRERALIYAQTQGKSQDGSQAFYGRAGAVHEFRAPGSPTAAFAEGAFVKRTENMQFKASAGVEYQDSSFGNPSAGSRGEPRVSARAGLQLEVQFPLLKR